MNIFNKLKRVKKSSPADTGLPAKAQTEEEYYTDLFTKHPVWNSPAANAEEELRWLIIRNFIFYIIGYHAKDNGEHMPLTILDLGCGRGWLSNLLTPYGRVTGIEPIAPVVKYANKIFPALDIRHGNARTLLEVNETFDIVVCSEVIEHIVDDEKAGFLKDLNALLNPNGFLIVTTPRKEAQEEWLSYSTPGQPVEDWLDENTLANLLADNGFTKHYLSRFSIPPNPAAPDIEIYQLWLTQKK